MKYTIITFTLIFSLALSTLANAQKLTEYKASNGVTYKPGDFVELGMGSGHNGSFVFITMGGWAAANGNVSGIGSGYAHGRVDIKKIKAYKQKGKEVIYFTVGGGNISNYNLKIEAAIEACEVLPCENEKEVSVDNSYDELIKLKSLLDQGIITQEEFDREKAEILDKN